MGIFKDIWNQNKWYDEDYNMVLPEQNDKESSTEIYFECWDYRSFPELAKELMDNECKACDDRTRKSCEKSLGFCGRWKSACMKEGELREAREFQNKERRKQNGEEFIETVRKIEPT